MRPSLLTSTSNFGDVRGACVQNAFKGVSTQHKWSLDNSVDEAVAINLAVWVELAVCMVSTLSVKVRLDSNWALSCLQRACLTRERDRHRTWRWR